MTWLPSPPVGSRVVVVGDLHGSISDLHGAGLAYNVHVHRELCPKQDKRAIPRHSIPFPCTACPSPASSS